MPELPEVETVARGLQGSVAGRRILSVTLRKTDFMDDPAAIERISRAFARQLVGDVLESF